MTLNICLFIFSLTAETTVLCVWLFEYDRESALLQIIVSVIALVVFSSKMILSLMTYRGRYLHSFVFALESCIVMTDAVALISSATSYHSPSRKAAIFYFAFFAAFVVLHAIRVFHIFYATARPPVQHIGRKNRQEVNRIVSITGIWVSRYDSSMTFAISDLVKGIQDLSPIFSLQLYATRDKSSTVDRVSPFRDSRCGPCHVLHAGRPDWEAILSKAIEGAHESSITTAADTVMANSSNDGAAVVEGESVGVFFCGSPAIARELQRIAQQVMANHQYATRRHSGTPCRCRLLVHKENF
jgi:respiratory burst oxidase